MAKRLGHVICTQAEDLWISLVEREGEAQLELQLYAHPRPGETTPMARGPALRIPAGVLPVLLRVLQDAQDRLIQRGTPYVPPAAEATIMDRGTPKSMPPAGRPHSAEARRFPCAPLTAPVECRIIGPDSFWPTRPVNGETRDVSMGGAQVWLPERLPRFCQVDVMMVVKRMVFRGRAEVAGVDLEVKKDPKTGYFRHSLRWTVMEGQAKTVLEKVIPSPSQNPA